LNAGEGEPERGAEPPTEPDGSKNAPNGEEASNSNEGSQPTADEPASSPSSDPASVPASVPTSDPSISQGEEARPKGPIAAIKTFLRTFTYISAGDLFTLANGILGIGAVTYILDNNRTGFGVAAGLLLLAIFADGLDGAVARRFGTKHHYGIYLDSIADTVSFCLAPAALIYMLFYDPSRGPAIDLINDDLAFEPRFDLHNAMAVITALMVGVMGMLRLARFSLKKEDVRPHFAGLPTPAMALLVIPLVLLWAPSVHLEATVTDGELEFDVGATSLLVCLTLILCSMLMVTELPYPKLRGRFAIVGLIVLALAAVGVTLFLIEHSWYLAPWFAMLGLQFAYTIMGPVVTLRYLRKVALPPE